MPATGSGPRPRIRMLGPSQTEVPTMSGCTQEPHGRHRPPAGEVASHHPQGTQCNQVPPRLLRPLTCFQRTLTPDGHRRTPGSHGRFSSRESQGVRLRLGETILKGIPDQLTRCVKVQFFIALYLLKLHRSGSEVYHDRLWPDVKEVTVGIPGPHPQLPCS